MPAAPQSMGSATSLTGNPENYCVRIFARDPTQGAQLCGSVVLGSDPALLPRLHHRPHLEHLDPVARAAGGNKI